MVNNYPVNPYINISLVALPTFIATTFGSALVFMNVRLGEKGLDMGMGFAAGVMIYVSFANLLIPSIERYPLAFVLIGFGIGIAIIRALDVVVPHTTIVKSNNYIDAKKLSRAMLIALAIAIHNIPEGLAVGTTTMYNFDYGLMTSIAIAIQDIPEGLAVAIAITKFGGSSMKGFVMGIASGLSEYLSAFIPLIILIEPQVLLPIMSTLSASMMIYVVIHEIAPEIFGHEHDEYAVAGFLIGLVISIALYTVYPG